MVCLVCILVEVLMVMEVDSLVAVEVCLIGIDTIPSFVLFCNHEFHIDHDIRYILYSTHSTTN
jgi:hypothetical protein